MKTGFAVNPNGQYFWIELLTGAALTDAMVDLIVHFNNGMSTGASQ